MIQYRWVNLQETGLATSFLHHRGLSALKMETAGSSEMLVTSYRVDICSRTEEDHGRPCSTWLAVGPSECKLPSSQQTGTRAHSSCCTSGLLSLVYANSFPSFRVLVKVKVKVKIKVKSKLLVYYDQQSVRQSVLVSGAHLGPATNFSPCFFNYFYGLVTDWFIWGALSDEKSGL
jgi:hypothetical protein